MIQMGDIYMKVMTFNIQHAFDYCNRVIDVDLFIRTVAEINPDFCGLNEVRGEGPIDGYTDQTNAIADGLGCFRYFGESIKVGGTSPYGNAFLSKNGFISVETIKIPDPIVKDETDEDGDLLHYESRSVIKAVVKHNDKEICFLVTHMGLAQSERFNAVDTIVKIIDSLDIPVVLMGDFNSEPQDEVLKPLLDRLDDTDCYALVKNKPTYPSYKPEIKIDYIFFRGLKCLNVTTLEDVISDHFPIIADFEV